MDYFIIVFKKWNSCHLFVTQMKNTRYSCDILILLVNVVLRVYTVVTIITSQHNMKIQIMG